MVQAYLEGYGGGKGFEAVGVSRERISAVFEEMCREVVERGKRYPPILRMGTGKPPTVTDGHRALSSDPGLLLAYPDAFRPFRARSKPPIS